MIEDKWLSDVVFTTVESKVNLKNVAIGVGGDFQTGALSDAVNTDQTNQITVRAWLERANGRKSTLVFCVDLEHVSSLTAMFRKYGIDARFVTGDTPKRIRGERLDAFKKGEYPVLLNCGVFTEGTDIPNIDCVILARPTRSRNLLVQMIGRGMRLHPGKDNCHIIDMVASLETGIVTAPTLFGLDPEELVNYASVEDLKKLKDRKEREKQREAQAADLRTPVPSQLAPLNASITFTDYESVSDLIEDTSGERYIRVVSQNAWVAVGDYRYILSTKSGNYLELAKNEEGFFVKYHAKNLTSKSNVPYLRPRQVATAETFEGAVHAADTFASTVFHRMDVIHTAPWRRSPASPAQLNVINARRDEDDQLTEDRVTKGQAGDMITKMRHGAKARFNKLKVLKRKNDRETKKLDEWEQLKQREMVKVGPITEVSAPFQPAEAVS